MGPREHHDGGRRLQLVTIVWNSGEVFVTIALGIVAGSLALVGFGLDSLIEVFTSVVVLWHMGSAPSSGDGARDDSARRLVRLAFAVLSAYLILASIRGLVTHMDPKTSPFGIAYLAVTAAVMVDLARRKRRMGERLASEVFLAEARMTQIDAYLAVGILVALASNAVWGWWWADPLAAATVGVIAAREATEGLLRDRKPRDDGPWNNPARC